MNIVKVTPKDHYRLLSSGRKWFNRGEADVSPLILNPKPFVTLLQGKRAFYEDRPTVGILCAWRFVSADLSVRH